MSISPPPYRDKDLTSQSWQKWFASITDALKTTAATLISWASINKAGSNLTDIETRNHDDLHNLNTPTHTHLTSNQYYGLTGGGSTSLHTHANISGSSTQGAPCNDGEDGESGYILLQPINTGGGTTNFVIDESDATISANYSITSGKNGLSVSPVTLANGVTVTIPDGVVWAIVS
jgi:hypothetical protein